MGATLANTHLGTVLEDLAVAARAQDVSGEVVARACVATQRALGTLPTENECQLRRRAEAYFSAVVRREVVRRRACAKASARLVVASVVEDLASAGRSAEEIWDELRRGWEGTIPREILEEYRAHALGRVAA